MDQFYLTLLMTEQCNLRCTYCYEKYIYKGFTDKHLNSLIKFIRKLTDEYSKIHISFFGGEPLLAVDKIKEILAATQDFASDFSFSMTTNGTLLTKTTLEELLPLRLSRFQVTLDGLEKNHDLTRKTIGNTGTFRKIYTNLMTFKDITENFNAIIRINASDRNTDDIIPLARLLKKDFSDDDRFKIFIRPVEKWGGDNDHLLRILNAQNYTTIKESFYNNLPSGMKYQGIRNEVCYAAMPNHLVIYPDGTVGKCTICIHEEINKIGNLDENGKLVVDSKKYAYWSRGYLSQKKADLSCPYGL